MFFGKKKKSVLEKIDKLEGVSKSQENYLESLREAINIHNGNVSSFCDSLNDLINNYNTLVERVAFLEGRIDEMEGDQTLH